MGRKLRIDPVTRIEGHACVELDIDDDKNVTSAVFKVMDFRGFEAFLEGMQVEMMPTVTPRICGTCPQSHHLVAAKAVDKVFGAKLTRTAELLRDTLNLGSIVHSHGVHFFALAGPDLLLGLGADPAQRNIVGLVQSHPDVATKALTLRSIGQRIVEIIGGRGTHPVSFVAGGVAKALSKDDAEKLKKLVEDGVPLGVELFKVAKGALTSQMELATSLPLETHYLGTVRDGALDLHIGDLRLRAPDGSDFDFNVDDYRKHLFEEVAASSYAKHVFCSPAGGDAVPYRVGALARINCADKMPTPMAQAELEEFREAVGHPCHHTVMYHYARLIELVYALEKLAELVKDDDLYSDNTMAKLSSPRSACAHVEAQRGVLIHDYEVDDNAIVTNANLIVATQQNIAAINATVGMAAQQYIDQPDDILLNAVEFGIRCYDPCLSCATHRIGEMKLDVSIRHNGEVIRRVRR